MSDDSLQVGDLWSRAIWAFERPSTRIKNFNKHSDATKKKWHKKIASEEGRAIRLARRFDVGLDLRDYIFESDVMPQKNSHFHLDNYIDNRTHIFQKSLETHNYLAFSKITHLANSFKMPFPDMWIEWERPSDSVLQGCLIEQKAVKNGTYWDGNKLRPVKGPALDGHIPKGSTDTAFTFYTFNEEKRELAPHEWSFILTSLGAPSQWKDQADKSHAAPVSYVKELARGVYSTNLLDDEVSDNFAPPPSSMFSGGAKSQDQYKESCRRALPDKSLAVSQSLDDFFDLLWRTNLMHKTMVLPHEPDVLMEAPIQPDHPMLFVLKLIEVLNYPWISKDYVAAGNQQKSKTPRVTPSDAYYRCRINLPKPDGITVKEPSQREGVYGKRLHQVRGHWRIYTDEFGNFKKKTWIKSHRRGDAKLGVVHKDYVLTAETEKKEQYA